MFPVHRPYACRTAEQRAQARMQRFSGEVQSRATVCSAFWEVNSVSFISSDGLDRTRGCQNIIYNGKIFCKGSEGGGQRT